MPRITLVAAAIALVPLPTLASGPYGVPVVSEVRSVYDGDTFRVDVEGWPRIIGNDIPIRLLGADTPELRSRCETEKQKERERALAREARAFTASALERASNITLHSIERGSFFRVIADVKLDGKSLSEQLLQAGYAIPFEPGNSDAWCGDSEAKGANQ